MPWHAISQVVAQSGRGGGGLLASLVSFLRSVAGVAESDRCATNRAAFTAAVIGLSAKLAKSDGVAIKIEADTFEHLFPVPESEIENVRRLFQLASRDVAGFEAYADEIAHTLKGDAELKRRVLDALLVIACADGVLHPGENHYLSAVAERFGYSQAEYLSMRASFVHDADDPYVILGASRSLTDGELKAHYRRLVKEHHPDALAAKGLKRELQEVAERKIAAFNAAWEEIAKERGL